MAEGASVKRQEVVQQCSRQFRQFCEQAVVAGKRKAGLAASTSAASGQIIRPTVELRQVQDTILTERKSWQRLHNCKRPLRTWRVIQRSTRHVKKT